MSRIGTTEGSAIPADDRGMNVMNGESSSQSTKAIRRTCLRATMGLLVFALAVFLLLAVGSYDPGDWPLSNYPPNPEVRNVCGRAGAWLAAGFHMALGNASYPLILLVAAAGAFVFIGEELREKWIKVVSGMVFVLSWASLADLLGPETSPSPCGAGGFVGRLLNSLVFENFGWGAYIILPPLLLASVLFLTEFAPISVLAMMMKRGRRRRRKELARQQGLFDAGPEPAPTALPASRAPAKPSDKVFVSDKPVWPDSVVEAASKAGETIEKEPRAAEGGVPLDRKEGKTANEFYDMATQDLPGSAEERVPAAVSDDARAGGAEDDKSADEDAPKPEPKAERAAKSDAEPKVKTPKPIQGEAAGSQPVLGQTPPAKESPGFGPDYQLPGVDLLEESEEIDYSIDEDRIKETASYLEKTLEEFGVDAQVVEIDRGPVITLYEIDLAPGIKIGKIMGLSEDIARALSAPSVRIVGHIPGKPTVGIEIPNPTRETVRMRELIASGVLDRKRMSIPMLIGKDSSGEPLVADLSQMPHLLIAGATGTGKSVCINSLILSMLLTQRPDQLKMLLVDPKMVEFSMFKAIPHLMAPVLSDMKKATSVLEWATVKMDERYEMFARVGSRNIQTYNNLGEEGIRQRLEVDDDTPLDDIPFFLPYIVIIIDELADLMMTSGKEVENAIIRLSQKSRAVGIHLIIATQRPSVDVITGLIKSNLPSRIGLKVASKVDSRTILDRNGAEKLLGKGDMLFLPPGSSKLIRAQGSFVSDEEIRKVVQFLQAEASPVFDGELVRQRSSGEKPPWERDELFVEAVKIIAETQRGSVSLLQRRLTIGYSRAARLIDMMAEMGLVGDYKGSQAREVYITLEEWEEQIAREQA